MSENELARDSDDDREEPGELRSTPAAEPKTDPDALTVGEIVRMENSADPTETKRAREIWQQQMGPALEALASIGNRVTREVAGPLLHTFSSQLKVDELLKASLLTDAITPQFDIPAFQVPGYALDTSIIADVSATQGAREARRDQAASAAVDTAETVRELVEVSREQHRQLTAVTEALATLAVQGDTAQKAGRRQFRAGFLVGIATLIVAAATLWFSWQMWLAAS